MRISDWSSDVCSSDLPAQATDHYRRGTSARPHRHARSSAAIRLKRKPRRRRRPLPRSEERRVGKECVSRVDLGGRRIIKKNKAKENRAPSKKDKQQNQQRTPLRIKIPR